MRILFGTLIGLLATTRAFGACPDNSLFTWSWDGVGIVSSAPSYSYNQGPGWKAGEQCDGACYDLREGLISLRGAGGGGVYYASGASVDTQDIYRIIGVPTGVPYAFTAELQVEASSPDSASLNATIGDPFTGPFASDGRITHEPHTSLVVSIPLVHAAEEPFPLRTSLATGGFREGQGWCLAEGRIRFRGLPAGAHVVSCQAYDMPTPARTLTWGSLKASYR